MKKAKARKAQKQSPQLALHLQALQLAEFIKLHNRQQLLEALENVFEAALFHTPPEMFNEVNQFSLYTVNELLRELRKAA